MMRVICQFRFLTIIVLSFFVLSSKGQIYQSMPQYGYSGPRFNMDSTLSIPTTCGVPTLKSNLTKKAAIAFDSCNGVFYQYNPKTLAWSQISGGGGSTDTTSLSNRINLKLNISDTSNKWVNSVTKLNDSTIRVIKDGTTTDITLTPAATVTAATRLVTTVYNNSGSTITKGSVIYINGRHSSNLPTIALAQANTEANSYSTFALVQDDILNNNSGTVIQAGNIGNLNLPTASYTDGQLVYLSPTVAGGITTTKPLAPYHIVKIGTITRAHPTFGSIELKIENGWQLDELSDVKIDLVSLDSTILQFSRVDSLWHDVNPTTAMGNRFLKISDSAAMLNKYLRKTDTTNKFVNRLTRTPGKDSIIFFVGATRYAIKDSLGAGASPGGTTTMLQFNSGNTFEGAYGLRYDLDYNRLDISNYSSIAGTQQRLSVFNGDQGDMPRNYETANFSKVGESSIGIYNSSDYSTGTGSSILLGNSKNTNADNKYPSFQIRNINDSTYWQNNYVQFNYQERNDVGTFVSSTIDLFKVYASGTVQLNPYGFSHSPSPRLIVGEDNYGAMLETSGDAFINGRFITQSSRQKYINYLSDDVIGSTYSVNADDHIIIYATNDGNASINLPAYPENGRELVIKQTGDIFGFSLKLHANGQEISGDNYAYIDSTQNSASVTIVFYDGIWYIINGVIYQ